MIRHVNVAPAEISEAGLQHGLAYTLYKTSLVDYRKLDTVKVFTKGVIEKVSLITPFLGPFNTWVKLDGYLKIDVEADYHIVTDMENSPVLYLDKAIIMYRDQNKYVEPQMAVLHLKKGIYKLDGYYQAIPQNNRQMPFSLKTADGKELALSEHLYH
jgi:hexosaminidase